ncbi:MAG: CPBP family intramembrane metalloprotease [Calditrichaeota bacterium]|nr:MAG: CPBP family intramembrane metalloprotease [Calditrichota bacterium]MBL1207446.1 CPBP family intramembrane metalloprotease [Calditrichota bacterium]NOG47278.1 CPBP family intramembrane metalloprotease domain-containing protein [Calditrichota bacterium]
MIVQKYKQPLLFYLLATFVPWALWLIAAAISHSDISSSSALQSLFAFAGLMAPLVIAFSIIHQDKDLLNDFWGRFLNFKEVKFRYLFAAFFLILISILLAQAVSLLFGYSADQFQLAESFSFTSGIFPVWFLLIAAPLIEELAWHSYGTDCLRSRFSLFTTSVIFAIYWGIWHMPLSLIKDYYHSNLVETGILYSLNFLVSLIPFVLIMNWLYYKSNRNITITIIFHITAGYFNEIFCTDPMSKVIQTVLLLLFSIYLILNDKKFFFKK